MEAMALEADEMNWVEKAWAGRSWATLETSCPDTTMLHAGRVDEVKRREKFDVFEEIVGEEWGRAQADRLPVGGRRPRHPLPVADHRASAHGQR